MILPQHSVERLGHYEVGSKIFTLKSLALHERINTGKKLNFIYNDEIFDQYNWTIEPEPGVSINEFYRRRAQQLRNNYDYIILQYSGGPDSQAIYDTFINNDILLDEVVNFNSYEKTQRLIGTAHNADYFYNVKPVLDNMIKKYGTQRTKISIIDEIDMTAKVWAEYEKRDFHELLFNAGNFPSVWMMRGIWVKHVPHIWNMILEGKRVCVVLGADKTPLVIENGKYCTKFIDILCCDAASLILHDPDLKGHNFVELFYHTPDMPEIIIKQAHLLKQFVESQTDAENFENTEYYSLTNHRPGFICNSKQFPGNLKHRPYHNVIYPGSRNNIITPKPEYFGTRSMDCWWVNEMPSEHTKVWRHGIVKQKVEFNNRIKRKGRESSTITPTRGKPYYLE
jgi:hypothetical protein